MRLGVLFLLAGLAWGDCPHEAAPDDERCSLEAGMRLGLAIDTFVADGTVYATSGPRERSVGGFDFEYRLFGWRDTNPAARNNYRREFWVYGVTLYGARSTDINCSSSTCWARPQSSIRGKQLSRRW